MNKRKITIFCQAPADVIHVLNLYEKYKNNAIITLYCISVESIYNYIKSLKLNFKTLEFIPNNFNLSIRNPLSILKTRKKINSLKRSYFNETKNEIIYFFAIWYDWITFSFLKELSLHNRIIYYQHYKNVTEIKRKKYSLKEKIILLQYYFITGINLQYTNEKNVLRTLFPYSDYGIKKEKASPVSLSLLKSYSYKIKNVKKRSVLFFESANMEKEFFKNYRETIILILQTLKENGCAIFLKGHPRLGLSKYVESYAVEIIPKEIPAELLDISGFNRVLGITTTSIAFLSKNQKNVYSIIKLFDFYNDELKNYFVNYLKENSDNKIRFIKNIYELCS